jgi:A/G-specific adenine glycosylase
LHAAARAIVAEHQGRFPCEPQQIRALPGIGRYTAGAIASIGWDAREPILEANTIRVFSRLLAYRGDPQKSTGQHRLWEFAESVLPERDTGLFNQALMELGSEICTPRGPRCDQCPVRTLCPTFRLGLQDEIPLPKRKTKYEDRHEVAVIVRRGDRVVLRRCGPDERWAGLWDFPRFPVPARSRDSLSQQLERASEQLTGLQIRLGQPLATIKHGVTRFRITLDCYEADCTGGRLCGNPDVRWVKIAALEDYPLSVTGRQLSRLLAV